MLVAPNLPPHQNPDPYHISKYIEKLFTMYMYIVQHTPTSYMNSSPRL